MLQQRWKPQPLPVPVQQSVTAHCCSGRAGPSETNVLQRPGLQGALSPSLHFMPSLHNTLHASKKVPSNNLHKPSTIRHSMLCCHHHHRIIIMRQSSNHQQLQPSSTLHTSSKPCAHPPHHSYSSYLGVNLQCCTQPQQKQRLTPVTVHWVLLSNSSWHAWAAAAA